MNKIFIYIKYHTIRLSIIKEQASIALESNTTLERLEMQIQEEKYSSEESDEEMTSDVAEPKTKDFPSSSEASHECGESTSCQIADSFTNLKPRSRQNPEEPNNQNANLFINLNGP